MRGWRWNFGEETAKCFEGKHIAMLYFFVK